MIKIMIFITFLSINLLFGDEYTFINNIRMGFDGPLGESTWSYSLNTNWNSAESRIINYTTSGQTVGLSLTKDFSLF